MIVTVIEHTPAVPLDRFAGWLTESGASPESAASPGSGVTLSVVRPWAGEPIPALGECGDGLLVLGGHGSAVDDEASPWLPATRDLLASASAAGLPTLGICLGAQLLALATGGRVQVAAPPGREAGVIDIHPRPETAGDGLLGGLAEHVAADHPLNGGVLAAMPSMHADAVVDLPAGAVWLASSRSYPYQAFRVGSAWGLQFHPEVGEETFAAWADRYDDVDTVAVLEQLRARAGDVEHAGREIAHRFAALVRERAALAVTS